MNQWAIWVDVEGFSKVYPLHEGKALKLIGALMKGIFVVGNTVCKNSPNSIVAYQTGDGFIISSECGFDCQKLPIGICIFLLKSIALSGGCAKCAVSTGNMADIQGCFPEVIQDNMNESGCVPLGYGLMTTFPVMGTALINAHTFSRKESGALLIWDREIAITNEERIIITKEGSDYFLIDWVHSDSKHADSFLFESGMNGAAERIEAFLRDYVKDTSIEEKWRCNTLMYNRIGEIPG